MSGRARDNRLVHFAVGDATADAFDEAQRPRPGDLITARITYAAPHHLVADGEDGGSAVRTLRRLRSGDAWEARKAAKDAKPVVSLGMPSIGAPAPLPAAPVCG
jgi:tRNA-2-methylthio-N6-dimethylallyladenosine synthase